MKTGVHSFLLTMCLAMFLAVPLLSQSLEIKDNNTLDPFNVTRLFGPGITIPPSSPVRTMAEWEELQAIAIAYDKSWSDGYLTTLREIAMESATEVEVIIICERNRDEDDFIDEGIDVTNMTFIPVGEGNVQRIWMRDYGPHSMYTNEVDSLIFVDWMYEPGSDIIDTIASVAMAGYFQLPLYTTTVSPNDLRLDGGNLLTDGLGNAFSSKRVINENEANGVNEAMIDVIMASFMGIEQYAKMDILPNDEIHHVDMHMKIIDEETLLFGRYPEGISDYAVLENNVAYIRDNFVNYFGEPYKIVRIDMPPDGNGDYPGEGDGSCSAIGDACYHTYTNTLFVNKKILVPTYDQPDFDQYALDLWAELMPGYEIVGINCNGIIPFYGAIHCITKEIGVRDPLWIVCNKVNRGCVGEDEYRVEAEIKHREGIEYASVFYKTDLNDSYTEVPMEYLGESYWEVDLSTPDLELGDKVYYYIHARATDGVKTINRPLAAPEGYWSFEVKNCLVDTEEALLSAEALHIFPNPVKGAFKAAIHLPKEVAFELQLLDGKGQFIQTLIDQNNANAAELFHFSTNGWSNGMYWIRLISGGKFTTQKMLIMN